MARDRPKKRLGVKGCGTIVSGNGAEDTGQGASNKDTSPFLTYRRTDLQKSSFVPRRISGGEEAILKEKTCKKQASNFSGDRQSKRTPLLASRPVSQIDSRSQLKTKTSSTFSSVFLTHPKYDVSMSLHQGQNETGNLEPKSILKNSPRRRDSTTSSVLCSITPEENASAQVLTPTTTNHATLPKALSGSTSLSASSSCTSPVGNAAAASFQLGAPSTLLASPSGRRASQELLSRLRLCYSRSISERPGQVTSCPVARTDQCHDSEGEILSRCSYKLGPHVRRASEPSGSKRVTFHDQTMRS
ncbi:hypothetical protein ElyMa_005796200 [Elysia marginata]|uniref:Uncharacterized protein n=1 Tax=Elysia marginata TaxID=1093978 RepID=A0AAV4FSF0_9GAST|nr:hypothetical protein ElyMa_005796200 [Elysia marginata]